MLKKQTVWLLTMLSLVVVLSVYYIMSPESKNAVQMQSEKSASDSGEVATEKAPAKEDTKEKNGTETEKEDGTKGTKDSSADKETSAEASEKGTVVTETADDDLFTTYRLDLEDARSKEREELNAIVSSDDATAKEKSEAYDKMTALSEVEGTEKQLETLIKTQGYEDALVNAEGDKINITVKSDKHSKSKATAIIDLVAKEIKTMKDVAVTFEPSK
ncbi:MULTISPECIES: stage III sporulation ratchet engulfment protein SpoIIIAH [unclassified Bacillus (in: firmicutes)]|uniref:stage III sporulation ratchet engulfment protein SpoIIIAH n=1 Tax=unclassified Bacillus (in: firmicutes) TaxID=185979 RepID=UPI00228237EA|nr:stage III sporulation ratchet engulfment protein SpoIIIAH [Bacillus sp. S20C3]MCY8205078.1 stage III sporulation ratchet engulfment protein SpoIIIAH [Bacillus sp. N12A5]MCY8289495.1 stage III sporulation ratchet engulfment protein SpoIIIAH [Bacillus sp. N13C7]MCY8637982.1 stage III sporulation ratchet engulfment protein SpoIIIAH [Bacillus sp. S17B2]MCY8721044.1 stage III sporulation ratchet engulfment protein SpoIIIAH [Bacillus sp. S10C12M]MCY9144251.1 stage III sporulation ratchet engulfme